MRFPLRPLAAQGAGGSLSPARGFCLAGALRNFSRCFFSEVSHNVPRMPDLIHIEALEVRSRIGVPDEERAIPQRLTITLAMEPATDFRALDDRLEGTVDYAAVCEALKTIAEERPRRLVETLAEEIAANLLARFPLRHVTVEVRKFVLPATDYVAIRIERP